MKAATNKDDIHDIKLEFLRSGPAHNQLLSPDRKSVV